MPRPKGSKNKDNSGTKARLRKIKRRYGADAFERWGKLGGNPVLLELKKKKKKKK